MSQSKIKENAANKAPEAPEAAPAPVHIYTQCEGYEYRITPEDLKAFIKVGEKEESIKIHKKGEGIYWAKTPELLSNVVKNKTFTLYSEDRQISTTTHAKAPKTQDNKTLISYLSEDDQKAYNALIEKATKAMNKALYEAKVKELDELKAKLGIK